MDLEGQVLVPPEEALGPKMLALNPKQRKFVCSLAVFGNDQTRAYLYSYGGKEGSAKASSSRLANTTAVREAVDEFYGEMFFTVGRAVAIRTLVEAASASSELDMKTRVKAAKEILDRIPGYGSKSEQKVTVTHEASTEELIAIIQEHAPRLGLDAARLLEDKGVVIDAEYTDIDPELASML